MMKDIKQGEVVVHLLSALLLECPYVLNVKPRTEIIHLASCCNCVHGIYMHILLHYLKLTTPVWSRNEVDLLGDIITFYRSNTCSMMHKMPFHFNLINWPIRQTAEQKNMNKGDLTQLLFLWQTLKKFTDLVSSLLTEVVQKVKVRHRKQ